MVVVVEGTGSAMVVEEVVVVGAGVVLVVVVPWATGPTESVGTGIEHADAKIPKEVMTKPSLRIKAQLQLSIKHLFEEANTFRDSDPVRESIEANEANTDHGTVVSGFK